MKTETREIYRCDFCKKIYFRKHACINHEKQCFRNPENHRVCLTCEKLVKIKTGKTVFNHDEDYNKIIELFYCSKIHSFLYPPKVEIKQNYFLKEEIADGNTPNIPMKKECEFYNDSFDFDFDIDNYEKPYKR